MKLKWQIYVWNLSFHYGLNPLVIFLINYIIIIIVILVGVAFFTLIERKVLGYIHFRIGPNKVGFIGIFQPFSDAIKLFSKEFLKPFKANFYFFLVIPLLGLVFILIILSIFPFWGFFSSFIYSIILFFCIRRLIVYSLLFIV